MEFEHFVALYPAILIVIGLLGYYSRVLTMALASDLVWMSVLADFFITSTLMGTTVLALFSTSRNSFNSFVVSVVWAIVMLLCAVGCRRRESLLLEARSQLATDLNGC